MDAHTFWKSNAVHDLWPLFPKIATIPLLSRPHFYEHSGISLYFDISFVRIFHRCIKFRFSTCLAAGLYVPGIYVKVLVLNLQDSHKIDNFSGMLSYAAFSSKSKFIKSALAYFDNDDNNLERKEEDKSSIRTRYLWLWRKANNRCPILLCCSLNDTFIYWKYFRHSSNDEIRV